MTEGLGQCSLSLWQVEMASMNVTNWNVMHFVNSECDNPMKLGLVISCDQWGYFALTIPRMILQVALLCPLWNWILNQAWQVLYQIHVIYTIVIRHLWLLGCTRWWPLPFLHACAVRCHGTFSCPLSFWDPNPWFFGDIPPMKRLVSSAFCWSVWSICSSLHWCFSAFLGSWCRTCNLWNSECESSGSKHTFPTKTIVVWSMISEMLQS